MSDSAPPPPPPPPPVPGPGSGMPLTGPRPGELLDRFLAKLIDYVILFIVSAIINLVIIGAILGTRGSAFGGGGSITYAIISSIISAVIYLGYFSFMESSRGQTVGKMLMKLHVVGPDGTSKPTMEQAVKRNIYNGYGILGIIPVVGGLIGSLLALVAVIMIAVQINGDPVKRQAWNDKFAGGTEVIKQG